MASTSVLSLVFRAHALLPHAHSEDCILARRGCRPRVIRCLASTSVLSFVFRAHALLPHAHRPAVFDKDKSGQSCGDGTSCRPVLMPHLCWSEGQRWQHAPCLALETARPTSMLSVERLRMHEGFGIRETSHECFGIRVLWLIRGVARRVPGSWKGCLRPPLLRREGLVITHEPCDLAKVTHEPCDLASLREL